MPDFSIFLAPEAWISLLTLLFLELVLGIDNLVFITITTDRLPAAKQHIGRRLGLLGALTMRILFLCFASYLVKMSAPLFFLSLGGWAHGVSLRDLVLIIGGAYLIFKGISELREMLRVEESAGDTLSVGSAGTVADASVPAQILKQLTLPQAVGTIMVMDLVFSIDSVITAVGLVDQLIIMIIAVMTAVFIMIVFIDAVSAFIDANPGMRILALAFIAAIGVLLVLDGAGIHSGVIVLDMQMEKLMVYFAMITGVVLEVLKIRYAHGHSGRTPSAK